MAEREPQLELPQSLACLSLGERIDYWNSYLDSMPADSVDDLTMSMITNDLDRQWGWHNAQCLIRGYGQSIVRLNNVYYQHPEDFLDLAEGYSRGFEVSSFGREAVRRWRVAYLFDAEEWPEDEEDASSLHFMLRSDWASIVPVQELEDPLYQVDVELQGKLHDTLSEHSDRFAELLRDPKFFTLTSEEQRLFVNRSILDAEKSTLQYGGIKRPVLLEGERAYVCNREDKIASFAEVDISDDVLWGQCLGLDALVGDQLRTCAKVHDEMGLYDRAAGLCLVVRFEGKESSSLDLENGTVLYVPISGQEVGATFSPDETLVSYL